jgi:hypothetical protein
MGVSNQVGETRNPVKGGDWVTSADSRPRCSLTCPDAGGKISLPYGSATLRPYVGAVKRVALPIV